MTKRERKLYCYVNKARGSTSSFLLLCGLCSPLKDISQPEEGGTTTDGGWPIGGSWKLNITFILGHSCSSRLIFPSSFLCCCHCQIILRGFQGTKLPSPNWELRRDWHAATLSSNKMATRPVSGCKRHFPRAWRYRTIPQAHSSALQSMSKPTDFLVLNNVRDAVSDSSKEWYIFREHRAELERRCVNVVKTPCISLIRNRLS